VTASNAQLTSSITADAAPAETRGLTTNCNGTAFESEVDCNTAHDDNDANATINCGKITSDAEVGCNGIGTMSDSGDQVQDIVPMQDNSATVASTISPGPSVTFRWPTPSPKSTAAKDLLIQTTGYELLIRPAWASALSRTLMGWNENLPSQLSSRLPGDHFQSSIASLCTEIKGQLIDQNNCATREVWTQLVNGVPGIENTFSSMSSTCNTLGGISFGSSGQYCALKGAWTQVNERLPGGSSWSSISNECDKLGGTMFGSSYRFCALKGYHSQFSTRMVGDSSWISSMESTCKKLGGASLGQSGCIVEGIWAQMTTKLPFDSSWASYFPSNVCDSLEGEVFGSRFCAVKGSATQLSTKLPGDSSWFTNFPTDVCDRVGGLVFGRYCAAKGSITQLSTKLPGDSSWSTNFPPDVCNELNGGASFPSPLFFNFCAAEGPVSQLTTRIPGDTSWS